MTMGYSQYVFVIGVLAAISLFGQASAQYEDVRCKCVCPQVLPPNGTELSRKIMVRSFSDPQDCTCENVVDANLKHICDRCECKWQRRNTTTIKVVVILIICVVSLLFLYMLFLLCLDPLMSRRPKYLEHHNEEVNLDTQSVHRPEEENSTRPRNGPITNRVKHEVHRLRDEQQRWKGTVSEQRKHIFDRHTMLN
ncbi:hypothetical protein CAPTEDRAFT_226754 [Capitella teleta]|uniref:Transmembrane protein 9 n=1 Tax=Capitella teleta TaxID=283909 RepID=N1PBA0_CAPTE|nr:hypothetical protein CAPTEDRAFT_226754 [Capitella teleta]|eukprot:ELU18840.1 hypothetical protein CAPTEDRAFT_226754 [Capitella teleta]